MSRTAEYTPERTAAFRPCVGRGKEKKQRYRIDYSGFGLKGMRRDTTFAKTLKEAREITAKIREVGFAERHISIAWGFVPAAKLHHTCITDTKPVKDKTGKITANQGRFWLWHNGS